MNFLEEYPKYCISLTDAPEEFHQAVGLTILASACGTNFFFPFGDQKIYPNIYLLIMGTSSDTRKSTSLTYGKSILQHVKPESIYPAEFSHEKLLQILQKNPSGVFFYSEFLTLMGLLNKDYMSGTKSFLTELYDSPQSYRRETLSGDPIEINNPCVSICTATTIDWFLEKINESDILGGFLTRFLLVLGQRKFDPMPLPPPVNIKWKGELIQELRSLSKIKGVVSLSPEAERRHNQWYRKYFTSLNGFRYGAFFHRHQIYLLKIAMITELAESRQLIISEQSMNKAINFINWVGKCLKKVENNELTFNRFQRNIKTVKNYLHGKGRVARSQLIKNTRLSSRDIREALETLTEGEEIKITKARDRKTKRTTTYYETSA